MSMGATMQGLVFHAARDVRVEEVPTPTLVEATDAILRIDKASICGSDLHPYTGRMDAEDGFTMGHEYMGTVVEVGSSVQQFEVGDRALGSFFACCGACWLCRRGEFSKCLGAQVFGLGMAFGDLGGTQTEYARIPMADLTLRKIPDDVTDEQALFVGDILTTAYDAVKKTDLRSGDVVAVVGAGPVGLFAMMSALALGAAQVVVIDKVASRLALASSLGAIAVNADEDDAQDVILELTDWRGADVVVDAVGHESALKSAMPLLRMGGHLTIPGVYMDDEFEFPIGELWIHNTTIHMGVANIQAHMDEVLALVRAGRIDPTALITHRLPLDQAPQGYELFASREALKVVLEPSSAA